MSEELTTTREYNMENWLEASKNWDFIMYSPEKYAGVPETLSLNNISFPIELNNNLGSLHNSGKVSQKRETFFGDNIRDAIKTIKR